MNNILLSKRALLGIGAGVAVLLGCGIVVLSLGLPPLWGPSPARLPLTTPHSPVPAASSAGKITWSEPAVSFTLSPGASTLKNLTFTSNQAASNLTLWVVPELAGFVSVQPGSFASVAANQPQKVILSAHIPQGAALGTYDGTIHVKSGSATLPQTLKVDVNVWHQFADSQLGLDFNYPPNFHVDNSSPRSGQVFTISDYIPNEDGGGLDVPLGCSIDVMVALNAQGLSVEQWTQEHIRSDGTNQNVTVAGITGIKKTFFEDITANTGTIFVLSKDNKIYLFSADGSSCTSVLLSILSTLSLSQ